MLILYAISVVSFCALVWAAYAITRHVRKASSATPTRSETATITDSTPAKPPRTALPSSNARDIEPRHKKAS